MTQKEMDILPKGWVCTPLTEAIDKIVGGGTPSKAVSSYYEGEIPWMTVKDMNKFRPIDTMDHISQEGVNNSSTNVIPAGTPIIATRMSLGKIVRANFDSAINQDLKAIFLNNEINDYYFEYWYRSMAPIIESIGTGTTVKGIKLTQLHALDFMLPPLPEQKRIVEKLDSLLAQVDTIQQRLNNLPDIIKRFRQSVLAAAVSGKLTEQWREINEVNDWKTLAIGDISTFQNGFAFKSGWFADSGKYQVIKLGNVKDDYLKLEKSPAFINSDIAKEYIKYKPNVGDILISMTGTKYKGDYGYVCRVNEDLPILINQRVGRIVAKPDLIDSNFLLQYMRSELFRVEFLKGETGGVNQGNVGTKHIQSCPIGIPSLKEQTEIVRLVEQYFALADTLEKNLANAKQRVDNLTQSILAKAFRGELVPQDPNDEPADKLLARIKAARLEAEKLEKAAKKAAKASKK